MQTLTIYGIKSCDTMKKAMTWLEQNNIDFTFHDYKKQGISTDKLAAWLQQAAWDELINKRGTTWRKLEDSDKNDIDNNKAIRLMSEHTSMIKRPVLEIGDRIYLGFKPELYQEVLL